MTCPNHPDGVNAGSHLAVGGSCHYCAHPMSDQAQRIAAKKQAELDAKIAQEAAARKATKAAAGEARARTARNKARAEEIIRKAQRKNR